MKKIRIGYMKVKEYKALLKVEAVPITGEEALAILRGEKSASEIKARDKEQNQ